MSQTPSLGRIVRSTLIVMAASALAKAISLGQTVIVADKFGPAWDTYVAASGIPDLIVILISGGALVQAFLPVFSGFVAEGDRERAWRLASATINTVFLAALVLSALAFLLAPWLVPNVLAPGFADDPDQATLTVELLRTLLLATIIFSISGLFMGILQAHQNFFLPALAAVFQDTGLLFGIIFLVEPLGMHGVAWGAVIGAACHFLVQVPGLIYFRARWRPVLGWGLPELRQVVRLMIPRVLGLGLVFWFNLRFVPTNIGSRLGEGSIAAFQWGWQLMQIPETLLGTALATVIFPTLATLSALGDVEGKRRALSGALRYILAVTIPAAFGMLLIGRPLVSLLERGAFEPGLGDLVYSAMGAFTLGLITHSVLEVVARAFYADRDTLTPLGVSVVAAGTNLILALVLGELLGVGGMALGNSVAVLVEASALLYILRRRWAGVEGARLASTGLRALVASLAMSAAVLLTQALLGALLPSGDAANTTMTIASIAVAVGVGGVAYLAAGLLLRIEEIRVLPRLILRRTRTPAQDSPSA
jgi:putative peptidoglycan lipid II flippase